MTSTTPPNIDKLLELVNACAYDANALSKGTKSGATALRKKLSQISKECTRLRGQALMYQKSIPTKTRKKKVVEQVAVPELETSSDVSEAETEDIPPPPLIRQKSRKPRMRK